MAAGDPLLVPYLTVNPGWGWLAVPSAEVQPYVNALKHNVSTGKDSATRVNVAAGRWEWVTGQYDLLIVLVSSASLDKLHLESPAGNASDLCAAARGEPRSQLEAIAGIPGSKAGLCALPSPSALTFTLLGSGRHPCRLQSGQRRHTDRDHFEVDDTDRRGGQPPPLPSSSTRHSRPEASWCQADWISI